MNSIIKIYNNVDEINLEEFPDKFIFKYYHWNKMNIFCYDKFKFNISKVRNKKMNAY